MEASSSNAPLGRLYNVGNVRPQSQVVPKHVGPMVNLQTRGIQAYPLSKSSPSHFNPLNLGERFESALRDIPPEKLMEEIPPLDVKPTPLVRILQTHPPKSKHQALLSTQLEKIEPSIWRSSGGPHSRLESQIKISPQWAAKRDWALNAAMMNHVLGKLPKDSPLGPVLIDRVLNYQRKFAGLPESGGLQFTPSPFQNTPDYHRGAHTFNEAMFAYRVHLGQQLDCGPTNLEPVSDPSIIEHIYHRYEPVGLSADHIQRETQIKDLIKQVAEGSSPNPLLLDISSIVTDLSGHVQSASETGALLGKIHNNLIGPTLHYFAEEYVAQNPSYEGSPQQLENLLKKLNQQVKLFTPLQFGEQSVIYSNSLQPRKDDNPGAGLFHTLIESEGFTPGPNQIFESWGQSANLSSILQDMQGITKTLTGVDHAVQSLSVEIPKLSFPVYKNPHAFLNSGSVQAFAQIMTNDQAPPYQTHFAKGTMDLLAGIMTQDLGKTLQKQGLPPEFMTFTYHRIASAMEKAVANKDNFSQFMDQVQVVHEEIATLLAVTQPYSLADSQHILRREVENVLPEGGFAENVVAFSSFKNSGMRGLSDTVTALSWAKGGDQFARLNVVVQKDAYYESLQEVLKQNPLHSVETLNTDRISESLGDDFSYFPPEVKLDLFVCEFHHNISTSRKEYFAEDLSHQVDKMFENNMVAERFTIAIDTTISHTNSKEIQDFLTRQKDRIESGALNVVLYRSGQKFDMMGMDHFNGGVLHTIHNPKAWSGFGKRLAPTEEHLATLNLQGLTHYENYGHEAIEDYRSAIIEGTQRFVDPFVALPLNPHNLLEGRFWGSDDADVRQHWHHCVDGVTEPDNDGVTPQQHLQTKLNGILKIVPNYDEHPVFIDFKCPLFDPELDNRLSGDFLNMIRTHILATAQRNDWPMTERPSFGFPHSNITGIGNEKLRLTLGLESEETHQAYRLHLDRINGALMETVTNNPTLKGDAIIQKMREALNALH